jgi:hypothetical protein
VQCSSLLRYLQEDPLRAIPGACTSPLITQHQFRGSHGKRDEAIPLSDGWLLTDPVSSLQDLESGGAL